MPATRTVTASRAVLAGALLAAAVSCAGTASAAGAAPGDLAPPGDPAPSVVSRGVPLERLPDEVPEPTPGRAEPVAPPGPVLLGAGAGALVLLVLRQRRLAADSGPDSGPRVPELLTGASALARALATALTDDDGPAGLVLLRVEARPSPDGTTAAQEWEAADAVLGALEVAVPLVAEQVGSRARAGDGVVRLGMNRLAVVLPACGAAEAATVAARLRAALTAACGPSLSVAVGSAASPLDGVVPSTLLRAAERSLREGAAAAIPGP